MNGNGPKGDGESGRAMNGNGPKGDGFALDEDEVKKCLADNGVKGDDVAKALGVLKKTMPGGDGKKKKVSGGMQKALLMQAWAAEAKTAASMSQKAGAAVKKVHAQKRGAWSVPTNTGNGVGEGTMIGSMVEDDVGSEVGSEVGSTA